MLFRVFVIVLLLTVSIAQPFTSILSMKLFTREQFTSADSIKLAELRKNPVNYVVLQYCNGTIGQDTFRMFPQLDTLRLWKTNVTQFNGTFTSLRNLYVLKSYFQTLDKELLLKFPNLRQLQMIKNTNVLVDPLHFPKLKNLQSLEISEANFTEFCVTRRWFNNMEELRVLVLNDNHIKCIEEDAFYSLKHLEKLDLTYNDIVKLGEFVFNPLIALQQLGLYGNKLEGFQMEMLSSQRMYLKDLGVDWTVLRNSKVKPEDLMKMMHGLKRVSFGRDFKNDKLSDIFCQNLRLFDGECYEDTNFGLSRML